LKESSNPTEEERLHPITKNSKVYYSSDIYHSEPEVYFSRASSNSSPAPNSPLASPSRSLNSQFLTESDTTSPFIKDGSHDVSQPFDFQKHNIKSIINPTNINPNVNKSTSHHVGTSHLQSISPIEFNKTKGMDQTPSRHLREPSIESPSSRKTSSFNDQRSMSPGLRPSEQSSILPNSPSIPNSTLSNKSALNLVDENSVMKKEIYENKSTKESPIYQLNELDCQLNLIGTIVIKIQDKILTLTSYSFTPTVPLPQPNLSISESLPSQFKQDNNNITKMTKTREISENLDQVFLLDIGSILRKFFFYFYFLISFSILMRIDATKII